MPERLGKYELLAPLAKGGTAEVFLARLPGEGGFEKVVVLKRLLPSLVGEREFIDMFLDEARLGARLDSSNIVQTIDLGEADGQYYIAMEYLAGMSLQHLARQAQKRAGGLPVELTLALAVQACTGLHYAHEATLPDGTPLKIVHRDVSPQNLVVTYEGVLKVVDFGIAHATQEARDSRTRAGFVKGKFAYMAPEQCLGKPFDRRTDVFALAIVVHELVTGKRLFRRDTPYATYQAIVNGEVTVPSQVNPKLDAGIDAVLMRALAPRPEDRYATAEALGEAFEELLHRRGVHASAGAVARFLTHHFEAEIAQQERLLHDLLRGESTTAPTAPVASWGGDEDSDEIQELSVAELEDYVGDEEPTRGRQPSGATSPSALAAAEAASRGGGGVVVAVAEPGAATLPVRNLRAAAAMAPLKARPLATPMPERIGAEQDTIPGGVAALTLPPEPAPEHQPSMSASVATRPPAKASAATTPASTPVAAVVASAPVVAPARTPTPVPWWLWPLALVVMLAVGALVYVLAR